LTIPLCCNLFALQVRKTVMLPLLDSLLAWAAHSEHQEVCAGPSWSSIALQVRSLLLTGVQDMSKSVLLHRCARYRCADSAWLSLTFWMLHGGNIARFSSQ
jgi:hypothetical protein